MYGPDDAPNLDHHSLCADPLVSLSDEKEDREFFGAAARLCIDYCLELDSRYDCARTHAHARTRKHANMHARTRTYAGDHFRQL